MLRVTSPLAAVTAALIASGLAMAACAAVIGVDGDYAAGDLGGAGPGGAAGAASTTTTSGGGTGGTTSAGGTGGGTDLPNGAPCSDGELCHSGRCVDGVCCNEECEQLCRSCALADQVGSCTRIPEGQNPDGDCDEGDLQACDGADHCKGLDGASCSENRDCLSDRCDEDDEKCLPPD